MGGNKQPAPPAAPDYAAATREGILADIETLPIRRLIDLKSRAGGRGSFQLAGKQYDFDFSGMGDADLAANQREIDRNNAIGSAQNLLDVQEQFGLRFLQNSRDQLKASDPIGFALRESLGKAVQEDLAAGGSMTDDQRRTVNQNVRSSQTARGNIRGLGAAVEEVMAQSRFSDIQKQQRMTNASAFLSGTTPLSQFGQLRNAQAGAAPFMAAQVQGIGLDPNAAAAAANFAQQSFGTQADIYKTQMQNPQQNPWMQGIGMAAGAATMFCWVAREVFGDDSRWIQFRSWMIRKAPRWLYQAYLRHGERFAAWLSDKPKFKAVIRRWMETKIVEVNHGV